MLNAVVKGLGLLVAMVAVIVTLVMWSVNAGSAAATTNPPRAVQQAVAHPQQQVVLASEGLGSDGSAQMRVANRPVDPYAVRAAELKQTDIFENADPLTVIFILLGAFYILGFGGLIAVIALRRRSVRSTL